MTGGANRGGKSLYSLDPDGYIVEFHQRPPVASHACATPDLTTLPPGRPRGRRSSSSTGCCS